MTALKSYMKWLSSQKAKGKLPVSQSARKQRELLKQAQEAENNTLLASLEEWCRRLLGADFEASTITSSQLSICLFV